MLGIISDPYIGFLIGVLGVVVGIYYGRKGIKYKQISYAIKTITITPKDLLPSKIDLIYGGQKLNTFSVTDVLIWCSGKDVINRDDIAKNNPVKIAVSSNQLFEYKELNTNEKDNLFQTFQQNNEIVIDFNYICKENGIAIRIYHNGTQNDVIVTGKIKGGKKICHVKPRQGFVYKLLSWKLIKKILSSKCGSLIYVACALMVFPTAFVRSLNHNELSGSVSFVGNGIFEYFDSIIIFLLCLVSFIIAIPHIYNIFKRMPPKELLEDSICEKF